MKNTMKFKKNYYQKFDWVDKIYRIRGPLKTRLNKIRLDKNEKPDQHLSSLFQKFKKIIKNEHLTAYPETEKLYQTLSKKINVDKKSIVLTPGSDAGIKACFDLCTTEKDNVLTVNPTFAMVDIYSKIKRVNQIKVNYDKNLNLDTNKILNIVRRKNIALVIIANPNSPTGTIIEEKKLINVINVCHKKKTIILIDEAYYGFCKTTAIKLIKKFPNLIISRTFSKAFGLAGCRVGFLVSNPVLALKLYNLRPMYEVNSIGLLLANEMLQKPAIVKKYIKDQEKGKNYLISKLKQYKIPYLDSYANFIHINFFNKKQIAERIFEKKNFLIRGGLSISGLENYLRISLAPVKTMKKVFEIIKKILIKSNKNDYIKYKKKKYEN
jgi:histidinol-phosphate aminotransferase